jgi:enolase-phosphatase E1
LGQKLLFGYSDKGDLLPYLSGHFDTTIGLKVEEQSYTRILSEITKAHSGLQAGQVLFVTDNPLEAIAADKVGIQVLVAVRPGNKELPSDLKFNTVDTFDKIHTTFSYVTLK